MSHQLVSRSPDLSKLRDEGYEIEIWGQDSPFLVVRHIPYVNQGAEVKFGTLVSELTLQDERTTTPGTHQIYFIGEYPCNIDGSPIEQIRNQSADQTLGEGLVVNHYLSGRPYDKPSKSYDDYHEKVTRYCGIISAPAKVLDISVTARTYKVVKSPDEESVFNYFDTNSSRAEIYHISQKLKRERIGIIGLGGTGSYVLDFVAKTPVDEIHLFDGDILLQHNAFRAPGAVSIEELGEKIPKVEYYQRIYSRMRKRIFAHPVFIVDDLLSLLEQLTFVLICIDKGAIKRRIIEKLEALRISFIDVGMGLQIVRGESLMGTIRTTTSTPSKRDHVNAKNRISFEDPVDEDYDTNIQIAELNALNACFAVIKWKKLSGFYHDDDGEHHSSYTLSAHMLLSEDQ